MNVVVLFLLLWVGICYLYVSCNSTAKRNNKNPFSSNDLYWCDGDARYQFCQKNMPNTFDHDRDIKEHILAHALDLPSHSSIIDAGAHIGDGSIPIADALISAGRGDLTVYAIDPSPDKCNYIKDIAERNNLNNITVLCYGLSDSDGDVFSHAEDQDWVPSANTGGTRWHNVRDAHKVAKDREQIVFMKLDTLIDRGIIAGPIGYIHFDVEDMEKEAILGGLGVFKRDRPILSAETLRPGQRENIEDVLSPLGYSFDSVVGCNSIFSPTAWYPA
jgi:FkbM family methyltransferase